MSNFYFARADAIFVSGLEELNAHQRKKSKKTIVGCSAQTTTQTETSKLKFSTKVQYSISSNFGS